MLLVKVVILFQGVFTFFLDEKSNKKIKPRIFLYQKSSARFPYRDPSRFARGTLPSANAQILTVILGIKILGRG